MSGLFYYLNFERLQYPSQEVTWFRKLQRNMVHCRRPAPSHSSCSCVLCFYSLQHRVPETLESLLSSPLSDLTSNQLPSPAASVFDWSLVSASSSSPCPSRCHLPALLSNYCLPVHHPTQPGSWLHTLGAALIGTPLLPALQQLPATL